MSSEPSHASLTDSLVMSPTDVPFFFGRDWCSQMTCKDLLAWQPSLPKFSSDPLHLTDDEPETILPPSKLFLLSCIPTQGEFDRIKKNMDAKKTPCWVLIDNAGLDYSKFLLISQVIGVVEFINKLHRMVEWLEKEVRTANPVFEASFMPRLSSCTWMHHFILSGISVSIHDILPFAGTQWLNDGSLDGILGMFQSVYEEFLFIPSYQTLCLGNQELRATNGGGWKQAEIKSGKYKKAYAIIHMKNHWGVLSIDFKRHEIAFGDSLSYPTPQETINGVRRWLIKCFDGRGAQAWNKPVRKLLVEPQIDGGSCGIYAANAVEHDVHKTLQGETSNIWKLESADQVLFHRIRYLALLVGVPEVTAVTVA
ncbi:hypothetical protein BCR41DRAFT_215197 [Lobosporangium transversale]|uniref:Ubiquitin-like protease family profile domain-containing protein n=1 Tax=Lobosporangium transversale TaxID=64571 RepID=A0A1Y2GBA8_9FUNG|nr:hypothetical protein BCR41DRAFT_215197 [Lobosporangium transversale]ORY99701.1 hypothetical protein BCR41DRAFT_215197 [Lobosporangium transversale]|eukprot:XP_021875965.1 hypothetical protein BCR41DRAFT_215197 [Lobosporangium transversale]